MSMTDHQVLNRNLLGAYYLGRGLSLEARIAIRKKVIEETEIDLSADFAMYRNALDTALFNESRQLTPNTEARIASFLEYLRLNPKVYEVKDGFVFIAPENVHKDSKDRKEILSYFNDRGLLKTGRNGNGKPRLLIIVRRFGRRMAVFSSSILEDSED